MIIRDITDHPNRSKSEREQCTLLALVEFGKRRLDESANYRTPVRELFRA